MIHYINIASGHLKTLIEGLGLSQFDMEHNTSTKHENGNDANRLLAEVKAGTHKQFILNTEKERVECRCGHVAIWWKTGYLCGTITAYPCRFN